MKNLQLCIDANFIIRLIVGHLEETIYRDYWQKWHEDGIKIVAPTLIYYEICNVLTRIQRANQISSLEARIALEDSLQLGMTLYGDADLHQEALNLAQRLGLSSSYDAHYLALAERLDIDFYTCDKKLFNAVQHNFSNIYLVA